MPKRMNKANKTRSILSSSIVPTINNMQADGKEYINISIDAKTELGKILHPEYATNIKTPIGNIVTIAAFMDYISIPGYPHGYLTKKKITKEDLYRVSKNRINIPNFYALVAYILCERVKQDSRLYKLLKNNKCPIYTSYNIKNDAVIFGKTITVASYNGRMGRYLAIVQHIETMIKMETFNQETIDAFIEGCKDKPELHILHSICNIHVSEDTASDEQTQEQLENRE